MLIPVKTRMTAANSNQIVILGALPLRISGRSASGDVITTKQLVYFTNSTPHTYLSKQACVSLGIISHNFPSIGEATESSSMASCQISGSQSVTPPLSSSTVAPKPQFDSKGRELAECGCLKRVPAPPPPSSPPMAMTEENVDAIQAWLLDYYAASVFNICEHQRFPLMKGPPMRIHVDPDATPVCYNTPIPVPIHMQDEVISGLERDTKLGLITPVPPGHPTPWCHRMVPVAKRDGTMRRTQDYHGLNKQSRRETHHTLSPFHAARLVQPDTVKTLFDAWHGYDQMGLHVPDRPLSTFITINGRYWSNVGMQGYSGTNDAYTKRYYDGAVDIKRKVQVVDDACLWDDTIAGAFSHAVEWLTMCGRIGVTLNPKKFVFAQKTVEFVGFEIGPRHIKPCARQLEAISNFPEPKNITDARSFFGLVNQVSFALSSAGKMLPFRELLKPGMTFNWTEELRKLFEDAKRTIVDEIVRGVEIFEPNKPTCLITDWSREGIGFWLLQKHCTCSGTRPFCCKQGWRVVQIGSRFLSDAETRYAPIEGEALAVAVALEKVKYYVLGCPNLTVLVDHKPLLKIFSDRCLSDIPNPRLLNLKEKTLRFRFQIMHIPGVKNLAADSLSRHPACSADHLSLQDDIAHITDLVQLSVASLFCLQESPEESDVQWLCSADQLSGQGPLQSVTWDEVKLSTSSDPSMHLLLETVEAGFPETRSEVPDGLLPFYRLRDGLYTLDGVVLYSGRTVIPPALRVRVLDSLHAAHQGVSQMIGHAELSVFWPGISTDINSWREKCLECNREAPSHPNPPPTPPATPSYPFQMVCADYFTFEGVHYLVVVDRYSGWPHVERGAAGAAGLIATLRRIFATFGVPEELTSDGGPEFDCRQTQHFLVNWGVHWRPSSVAYPHANQRAEVAVKTVKRMLMANTHKGSLDTDSFQKAMLTYRNTPDQHTGTSPAMCVFGRPTRELIPVPPGKYQPHPVWTETLRAREEALRKRHAKAHEKLSEHTRRLPALKVGDHVRVQNQIGPHPLKWDKTGVVVEVRQFDQYIVKVDGSGRLTLRNRKFLRHFVPARTLADANCLVGKPLEDQNHPQLKPVQCSATPVPAAAQQGITKHEQPPKHVPLPSDTQCTQQPPKPALVTPPDSSGTHQTPKTALLPPDKSGTHQPQPQRKEVAPVPLPPQLPNGSTLHPSDPSSSAFNPVKNHGRFHPPKALTETRQEEFSLPRTWFPTNDNVSKPPLTAQQTPLCRGRSQSPSASPSELSPETLPSHHEQPRPPEAHLPLVVATDNHAPGVSLPARVRSSGRLRKVPLKFDPSSGKWT